MSISKYRADIDGLRAAAVLSVVLFHLSPSLLPNGFLGVDIFFVISGYLITSIIYKDMNRGAFSYQDFYLRRIKRILPVFFVVLFVALALGAFIIPDLNAFDELRKSGIASTFFAANLFFMRGTDYFDARTEFKPLGHIWSLSIEEQFYFIFPLLLIIILRFEWLRQRKYPILFALGILTLASSFINLKSWGIYYEPYFLPHLRVPEMLVGALLAIASADGYLFRGQEERRGEERRGEERRGEERRGEERRGGLAPWLVQALSIGSLALIIISFFLPKVFVAPFFPGVASLIPCVATAVLLHLGTQQSIVAQFLSLKPVVWIGKISYSLYLWHWVVLAYLRYCYGLGTPSPAVFALAVVLMFALATLSYYFVEQPTRHLNISFGRSLACFYLLPASLMVGFYFIPTKHYFVPYDSSCSVLGIDHKAIFQDKDGTKIIGDLDKSPSLLIVGDSHTGHLAHFFSIVGKHEAWSAVYNSAPGHPWLFDYYSLHMSHQHEYQRARNEQLNQIYPKWDTIVLANFWGADYYAKDPNYLPKLEQALERLVREGKQIYLVNSLHEVRNIRITEAKLNLKGIALPDLDNDYLGKAFEETSARVEYIRQLVARKYPSIHWIDLTPLMPKGLMHQSKPVLSDSRHWNCLGSIYLGEAFINSGQKLIR